MKYNTVMVVRKLDSGPWYLGGGHTSIGKRLNELNPANRGCSAAGEHLVEDVQALLLDWDSKSRVF